MMLEPAQRAGDAPHRACEQAAVPVSADGGRVPAIRLAAPSSAAGRRAEQAEWMRRRRLERQLHDGAALRISALTLQIGLMRHRIPQADAELDSAVDALQDELHAVLQELRDVSGQIFPPLLDQAGLGPAVREAAERCSMPVRSTIDDDRFGPAAEGAAYYAVLELFAALDAAPGPDGQQPAVRAGRAPAGDGDGEPVLVMQISGVDVRHADAMLAHVWRLGATIDISRGAGIGTITARIPCE
jgi:hypothetical protein